MRGRMEGPTDCVGRSLMELVRSRPRPATPILTVQIPHSEFPTPYPSKGMGEAGGHAGVATEEGPVRLDDARALDLAQPL